MAFPRPLKGEIPEEQCYVTTCPISASATKLALRNPNSHPNFQAEMQFYNVYPGA